MIKSQRHEITFLYIDWLIDCLFLYIGIILISPLNIILD